MPSRHTDLPVYVVEPRPEPVREPLGALAARKGIAAHVLAGVRGLKRWDELFPVTEDELLAAVVAFESISLG